MPARGGKPRVKREFRDGGKAIEGGKVVKPGSLLHSCLQRIRRWRVPPNWSERDWLDQMQAQVASAAWEAERDYDPSRGIPLSVYAHRRAMASALTQYRREWTYSLRCVSELVEAERYRPVHAALDQSLDTGELLRMTIELLPQSDRWLIQQLFWQGRTQAEVARSLGISQPAVSKRKRAIIKKLLLALDLAGKNNQAGYKKIDSTHYLSG
jgi:RNA polymerase sigma factor (sigma-70 family)